MNEPFPSDGHVFGLLERMSEHIPAGILLDECMRTARFFRLRHYAARLSIHDLDRLCEYTAELAEAQRRAGFERLRADMLDRRREASEEE